MDNVARHNLAVVVLYFAASGEWDGVAWRPVEVRAIALRESRAECLLVAAIDLRVIAQQVIDACTPDPSIVYVHDRLVVVATVANRSGRGVIRLRPDLGQNR